MRARTGAWTAGTTFRYLWRADGKKIKGATKETLRLKRGQRTKRITVQVTGSKPGYATRVLTSKATKPVRR